MRRWTFLVSTLFCATVIGCGGESEEERLNRLVPNALGTTEVYGRVTVDGKPVKDLWVKLHSADPKIAMTPRGQTDAQGYFHIGTYSGSDGAPAGDYKIT